MAEVISLTIKIDAAEVHRVAAQYADQAVVDVVAERCRQMNSEDGEGWTADHDDGYTRGELGKAAACYADFGSSAEECRKAFAGVPLSWPFAGKWWKPKDRRRDLVRAAALAIAEIQRLDRAEAAKIKG